MQTKLIKPVPKNRRFATPAATNAREALGPIVPGAEVFAVTKGDYSLIDILVYVIEETGANRVTLCTWTAADGALRGFADLLRAGRLKDVRIICDPSFVTRKPEICDLMFQLFGQESIRCAPLHAKFAVFTGGRVPVTLRTSMNLNPNRRIESVELSTCPRMAEFHLTLADDIFRVFGVPTPKTLQSQSRNTLSPLAENQGAPRKKIGLF